MSDVMRIAPELETPVNPYSLLTAVNSSSNTAHTAWLIFIGLMTYMMIAVAGVTHKALLLETPVALPLLQVQIPLTQFFEFAPVLLVLFHLGLISQLVLLSRKTLEFDQSIRLLEATDRRTHPLRLELDNFFFVQAIAGPHRSLVMSAFLHTMSWLTLVFAPVLLILFTQVVFLPYHDLAITGSQRAALLCDVAMLVLIGVFLVRSETSFVQALWRTAMSHPLTMLSTGLTLFALTFFSLFVATVPGEPLDKLAHSFFGQPEPRPVPGQREPRLTAGFNVPLLSVRADGSLFGFQRNLVVTDTDLVLDKDVTGDEPSLNLRGRDLRFARLDRSDLHQADLTGADLSDASLSGADLRKAFIACASLDELLLSGNREAARCVTARRANLRKAQLHDALLNGADLRGALFDEARLDGAELAYALLTGASFASAHLEKADLTGGVEAQGANFLVAFMQGADLTGAKLQFADLSSAGLQGALLGHAHLHGAIMRDADLEGADVTQAKLQGADLTGAKVRAADLRGAAVWMTPPPAADATALSDLTEIVMKPLDDAEAQSLATLLDHIPAGALQDQMKAALAPVMAVQASRRWQNSTELLRWDSMSKASAAAIAENYRAQLTDHLGRLMCRARWSSGSVATGIARRSLTQQFKGDAVALYDRSRAFDCPGGQKILPRTARDLSQAADAARSN